MRNLLYKFTNADQKELESLLAHGFYSAGISFNILENDDIKAFFLKALPYFKLPTRYFLSNSLLTKEYSGLNTDAPIERELIRLAGPENKDQVLEELSEYVGKTGGFSANYLWATSASSERNWSSFNFVHSKLRNRLHNPRVEKIVYIYWNLQILHSLKWSLSVKELRNSSNLIEDNVVNLKLNETNSVEENNIDDSLSDSPLYIDSMDYADEIDDK
ncbi:26723_t:CDS:2 [Dentiscutata erythropus]|uniref:26723_t:CDS:1 n=1 Tax=Dentiscutata erythropus TaxID=1348616 RepID=A0A9N9BJ81_9GLOM|nr:26723_t:CDS:2 [Dentiscutata erythropus]